MKYLNAATESLKASKQRRHLILIFLRQWKCFQNKFAMLTHVCATSCAMMIADASPMSLLTVLPNCVAHVEPNAAKPEEKID